MVSILRVYMPTDSYVTADEPSQCQWLDKYSFVFVKKVGLD